MTRRRVPVLAMATAVALGCAACTSDTPEHPPTSSSESATTSTTSAPSTTPTIALPPEATKHTEAGAEAFARTFLTRYSEAARQGDTAPMDGLAAPECSGCEALRKVVEELHKKHQHIDRVAMRIDGSQVDPSSTQNKVVVGILANDLTKQVMDESGTPVATVKSAKFNTRATCEWTGSKWLVTELKLLK